MFIISVVNHADILGIYYIFLSSFPSICSSFFFFSLIKKPKNPCKTEGDDEEAKLRSGPAMF